MYDNNNLDENKTHYIQNTKSLYVTGKKQKPADSLGSLHTFYFAGW